MHIQTCTQTRLQVLFIIEPLLTYHFEMYFPLLSLPVSGKTLATLCEVIYLFIYLFIYFSFGHAALHAGS